MRRLNLRCGAAERGEDGAVLVMMAAFLVAMLAMAALVIDVGALLDERRQLQNGADAGALAVARSCGLGACDASLTTGLADANASDRAAAVDSVTYPAANQVRVATSTRAAGGGNILPYAFGQALSGQRGGTVHANATAQWTGVQTATVIPLVISLCDFNLATANGTNFSTTFTGPVTVIKFHSDASDCASRAGYDTNGDQRLPGGLGWVDGSGGCSVTISAGNIVSEDPGNSVPNGCNPSTLVNTTLLLPVFDDLWNPGNNGKYHIIGFAEFRLTGYRFPSMSAGTPPPCSAPATCIGGYLTRVVTTTSTGGGPNLGAVVVSLVS